MTQSKNPHLAAWNNFGKKPLKPAISQGFYVVTQADGELRAWKKSTGTTKHIIAGLEQKSLIGEPVLMQGPTRDLAIQAYIDQNFYAPTVTQALSQPALRPGIDKTLERYKAESKYLMKEHISQARERIRLRIKATRSPRH